jgi:NTP pyrophosphatase (non-canonical NTP hydrolase)
MSYNELELSVVRWSEDRGIIQNSDAKTQLLKAFEEMGELASGINKKDMALIKDGVGDVVVCLINVCAILDISITECLQLAYDEIKDRKGYLTKDGVFIKEAA